MPEATETEQLAAKGFRFVCELLNKRDRKEQLEVTAHIRAVTGKNYASVVNYNADIGVKLDDKLAMYKHIIGALATTDGRAKFPLQGSVGAGEKLSAPESAPEEAAPAPRQTKPVSARSAAPVVAVGDEDDEEALLRRIVERRKKESDQASHIAQCLDAITEHDSRLRALATTAQAIDNRLDTLNIPDEDEIKEIIRKALDNGCFPTNRVEDIAKDVVGKVAPKLDSSSIDHLIKPRVDDIIKGSIKDLIAGGPAALSSAPAAEVVDALASYKPDKKSLELSTYIIDTETKAFLKDLHERSSGKNGENVLLIGPQGCGKTTMAQWFAAEYGMPLLILDCANVREPRDWFGYKTAQGGSVRWVRSQLDLCLEAGNHVIVLDELPRTTDQVRNTLFPLLDHRRRTFLQERHDYINVGKGTVFFATANLGFQFTGSSELDAALSDRFVDRMEVNYLPLNLEANVLVQRTGIDRAPALKLAEVAETVRKKALGHGATLTRTISTRQLVSAAERFKTLGASSFQFTILNHFTAEGGENSERHQVSQMLLGKFGKV